MEDLSLHILDIVENSIAAGAKNIEIKITEEKKKDLLTLEITDDGKGMDEKTIKKVLDPFFTTGNKRKVGLGLPLLAQSAEESGGSIKIESEPGKKTKVKATFGYSHIDRKPFGNMGETLKVLIAGNPYIDFIFEYQKDGVKNRLDTKGFKNDIIDYK